MKNLEIVFSIFLAFLIIISISGCESSEQFLDRNIPPDAPDIQHVQVDFSTFNLDLRETLVVPASNSDLQYWFTLTKATEFRNSIEEYPYQAAIHYARNAASLLEISKIWNHQFFNINQKREWGDGHFEDDQWVWEYGWRFGNIPATIRVTAESNEDGWTWNHFISSRALNLNNFLWVSAYQDHQGLSGNFMMYNPDQRDRNPAIQLEYENDRTKTTFLRMERTMPDNQGFGFEIDRPNDFIEKEYWISRQLEKIEFIINWDLNVGDGCINDFCWSPPSWQCGDDLVVNHEMNEVAPESKTITYGTVQIDQDCWITQNLGASQKASGYEDSSINAAGWYWQFNRLQGYSHDDINRTPDTEWISEIDEDSDWEIENDPCRELLGSTWQVPEQMDWPLPDMEEINDFITYEITNIYSGPLYLHQAGILVDGELLNRGTDNGILLPSNSQTHISLDDNGEYANRDSWYPYNGVWYFALSPKSEATPLRCVKK